MERASEHDFHFCDAPESSLQRRTASFVDGREQIMGADLLYLQPEANNSNYNEV
ncbi:hypothetical protein J3P91_15095 [Pseudomonas sp. Z4-7]|uniref:hypothetical protein n=1 Tax=Pseudomonas sp. Z4-7 TaxID=2817413 RepID=UPI003DA8CA8F